MPVLKVCFKEQDLEQERCVVSRLKRKQQSRRFCFRFAPFSDVDVRKQSLCQDRLRTEIARRKADAKEGDHFIMMISVGRRMSSRLRR